jgi:ADP-dependent NAD(P)H-hydrate dehydratase / NAD(P)H-hydrate epimerase
MVRRRPILTAAAMRAAEQRAIDAGTSVDMLMERAGAAVAEVVRRIGGGAETLILCGPGNNGGDGYVAARMLGAHGVPVRVAALREPKAPAAIRARQGWTGAVSSLEAAETAPFVVDALFGTGLERPLEAEVARPLGGLVGAAGFTLAVDLPSGIGTDDGACLGAVPAFDLTLALGALKPAHRLLPAVTKMGQIIVADIGVGDTSSDLFEIEQPRFRAPDLSANKYSRGKVVVAAGAMVGAAHLAATAAQASGAGYVELLAEGGSNRPNALVRRAWNASALDDKRVGAIVCGPGLGRDRAARDRLEQVLGCAAPILLDADALTLLGRTGVRHLGKVAVITPHWGEFTDMFGDDGRDSLTQARAAAAKSGTVVLLKGAMSIVAHPDGHAAIGAPAPSWLASAGTGDVLSGVIGALLAGGMAPFEAAQAGVWLHAEAGRIAGPYLIADDVVTALPRAAARCL